MRSVMALVLAWAGTAGAQPQALEVPGFAPAAVVVADGSGEAPVVVALHGNFDRPEWMCAAWARVVRGRAFLLCPRGVPRNDAPGLDRWSLPPIERLTAEVADARRALALRYPGRIDAGPDVWVGFSQGAHRLSELAVAEPSRYRAMQLVEGGRSFWRAGAARRYAAGSGRVAFVCAMRWCEERGAQAVRSLRARNVEARLERIDAAHHDLRTLEPAIRTTFEWLVAGDPRFGAPR